MKKELRKIIVKEAVACLKARIKKGINTSEIDFLCGVATAMVSMERFNKVEEEKVMGCVPPKWIFSAIRNESIFESEEK
tara:strand:- start:919 stop:1155 length:237 start_codon:yes stop_codon:yes gene_type:complete